MQKADTQFTLSVLWNSEDLLSALGIDSNTLPPLIYRMRQLGYPPGWLKEAEMENSGLTLYDGNGLYEINPKPISLTAKPQHF